MLTATNSRRHDLDALRAFAMLLGIALHAAVAYTTYGWSVSDSSQSVVFNWFCSAVHGFRMQLFFVLSGYFTAMLQQRRGTSYLLNHRLKRVFLPLILFTPILIPLIDWILAIARYRQTGAHTTSPDTFSAWFSSFSLHHLWFLWFLYLIVLAYALISKIPKPSFLHQKFGEKWSSSPRCLLWVIPLTMLPQHWSTRGYPLFGPESSLGLIPMPSVLIYYAIFFGVGVTLFHFGDAAIARHWRLKLTLSLVLLFPVGMIFERWSINNYSHLQWASDIIQVSYTWLMVFGCIGFFREKCAQPSPKMRYLSDASYWLYLAHLPLVFGIQLAIQDWPLSFWIKFPLVNLLSFSLLLLSYHFLVRGKFLGKLLNGK